MKFEGIPKEKSTRQLLEEDVLDMTGGDVEDSSKAILNNAHEALDIKAGLVDNQSEIQNETARDITRQEVREFSKQESQYYRNQLAQDILQKRSIVRDYIKKEKDKFDRYKDSKHSEVEERRSSIEALEHRHREEQEKVKAFKEYVKSVQNLEEEIEAIKSSFWARFRQQKIKDLELSLETLKENEVYEPASYNDKSPSQIVEEELAKEKEWLATAEARVALLSGREDEVKSEIVFKQDRLVAESKQMIADFYDRNRELLRESMEDPAARDVVENCRELGVLLRHGLPLHSPDLGSLADRFTEGSYENNTIVDSRALDEGERIRLCLSLQPSIATHTGWSSWPQGLIVAGGEIQSADKSDLFTKTTGLDSRNPKYSGLASSKMSNIKEAFKSAVENEGNPGNKRSHNEVVVKHPKFSAVYVSDRTRKYGTYDELNARDNSDTFDTRWALEQSMVTGLPAVIFLESGKIINIATDEEMTMDDLLNQPIEHTLDERLDMFTESVKENMQKTGIVGDEELDERFEYMDAIYSYNEKMEAYKQINRDLAQARLQLWEAEKLERHSVLEKEGWEVVWRLGLQKASVLKENNI